MIALRPGSDRAPAGSDRPPAGSDRPRPGSERPSPASDRPRPGSDGVVMLSPAPLVASALLSPDETTFRNVRPAGRVVVDGLTWARYEAPLLTFPAAASSDY
ncbi:hypothetical protein Ssi03_49140 [Sphaerisporangium siamense]|nr:hypothetical protein Ssi03_49140 [Sphaerisporangium siamense]